MVKINKIKNIQQKICLKNNSGASNSTIKKRIVKEKLLEYKCFNNNCLLNKYNITNFINPNSNIQCKIKLDLDHINGNNKDNRLENLRFLCPQCHTCTDTYKTRKIEINKKRKNNNKKELVDINYSKKFTEKEIQKKESIIWKTNIDLFKKIC